MVRARKPRPYGKVVYPNEYCASQPNRYHCIQDYFCQCVSPSYQPFQGGEIRNEDWLFQPSKSPKSERRIQDGSTETTYLRWSP